MSNSTFFAELRRRNVIRMAGLYLVAAWLVTQVSGTLLPGFDAPPWVFRAIVMLLAIGFVPAIVFAWVYEITPEGIKRESEVKRDGSITPQTGRRMDRAIIVVLALALVVFAIDRFVLAPRREAKAIADAVDQAHAAPAATATAGAAAGAIPDINSDPSIAVLPLVNRSSDAEQGYFSDGISDELLNLLAKVPKLRVIARTSSFSFKGTNAPVADIARALQVAALLEGSVRRAGDTVRISVELIRAKDSAELWSQTYERKLDDIFRIQDEIAAAVVEQLKVKLLGAAPTATPVDAKAYPLILQAEALVEQQSKAGREQAIALFQQALAIAPNEARAWAGLGRAYINQAIVGERTAAEAVRLSRDAAGKALAANPDNVLALVLFAKIGSDFDLDFPAAAKYLQRALAVEPGNMLALNVAVAQLMYIGRIDEAVAVAEYRVAHDPANPTAYNSLGSSLYGARRWDAAIAAFRTVVRLSPEFVGARAQIAQVLVLEGDGAGALRESGDEPDAETRDFAETLALHAVGRAKDADAALQSLIAKYAADQPANIAMVYANRHDADAAFRWLDKALAARDPNVASVFTEPLFDPLHDDARWLPYVRRIGYAPEQLATIELTVALPK